LSLRKLLFLLVLFAIPTKAQPTILQSCSNHGVGASSCSLTIGPNHAIVIVGAAYAAYTLSDSNFSLFGGVCPGGLGGSVSFPDSIGSFSDEVTVCAAETGSHSGSDTFSIIETQFNEGSQIFVYEVSGLNLDHTHIVDVALTGTGTASGSGVIGPGNLTTTQNEDLIFVGAIATNNGQTLTAGSGYTLLGTNHYTLATTGSYFFVLSQDQLGASAGTYPVTVSTSASGTWGIVAVAYAPGAITTHKLKAKVI
jgi:hypothetical protein